MTYSVQSFQKLIKKFRILSLRRQDTKDTRLKKIFEIIEFWIKERMKQDLYMVEIDRHK